MKVMIGSQTLKTSAVKSVDKTKAIVLINPNNPTGAVYSKELLLQIIELAREFGFAILSERDLRQILYDDAQAPIALRL